MIVGFELDIDAAVVERVDAAAGAHRRSDRLDGRVSHYCIEQGLLALGHGLERDILRRFRLTDNQSGILLGKEALGNDHI